MEKFFERVEQTPLYQGFFKLSKMSFRHSLFGGGESPLIERELFYRNDCVAVILYDPARDCVVLIEQFRVGAILNDKTPWLVEIVAGAIEEGELPEEVARRESLEEAGREPGELIRIGSFYTTPGGSSEKITLYCGIIDSEGMGGIHGLEEEGEDIWVKVLSFDEAWRLFEAGEIESAIPIIALQWLAMNRKSLPESREANA